MHIIAFLLFGLIVGVLARRIVPGRSPGGWLVSLVFGVGGAYLGGFLGRAFGLYVAGQSTGLIMAIIGAVILLFIYHALSNRRRSMA
jgi:uncharacterized membrane protein YeaQ/YmgE (transglycosylase-associated protein family)